MTVIPEIDSDIGIRTYATSFPGLGGGYRIRMTPDDFEVYEILSPSALKSIILSSGDGTGGSRTAGSVFADSHRDVVHEYADNEIDVDDDGASSSTDNNNAKKGGYAVYKLTKRGIDTAHALAAIYKITGARLKPLGLKDASAATQQYVCSVGARGQILRAIDQPRFGLKFEGFSKKPLTKKQMLGNRFRIRIAGVWDDIKKDGNAQDAGGSPGVLGTANLADFDELDSIPNFYGYQRFGSARPVTHLVGRAIIRRDFAEAVRLILEFDSKYDAPQRREMRRNLADSASYAQSARMLPTGMDTERLVLERLAICDDAFEAFKAIPLQLRRLYVSAYQSYLFNCTLSAALAEGENMSDPVRGDVCFDKNGDLSRYDGSVPAQSGRYNGTITYASSRPAARGRGTRHLRGAFGSAPGAAGMIRTRAQSVAIPLVGYSYYAKTRFAPYVSYVLEEEGVSPKDFFIKEMQEIGGEGGFRDAMMQCAGYSWDYSSKTVQFSLIRGSFATMLLRELIKPPDPIAAGF